MLSLGFAILHPNIGLFEIGKQTGWWALNLSREAGQRATGLQCTKGCPLVH